MTAFVIVLSGCATKLITPNIPLDPIEDVYSQAPDCALVTQSFQDAIPDDGNCDESCCTEIIGKGADSVVCLDGEAIYWKDKYELLRGEVEAISAGTRAP